MKINAENLEEEINETIKQMERQGFIEEEKFAIYNTGALQVQVLVTRNDDEYIDIYEGIAE